MVFVLNKQKKPLDMCTEAKARYLLSNKKAVVHKIYPFTIRLKENIEVKRKPLQYRVKIDPGAKATGLALVDEKNNVVFLAEIEHRADSVKSKLKLRRDIRRTRRNRELRYRRCKFTNTFLKKDSNYKVSTSKPKGWIPPSIVSIEQNIINWIKKLKKLCNITSVSLEFAKFDTQLLENPDIKGVEYQQGTLNGYEIREYLLNKYAHTCQYCGGATGDNVLEMEHMISRANHGSNRLSNLTIACHRCNNDKGELNLSDWLDALKSKKRKNNLDKTRIKCITEFLEKGGLPQSRRHAAWVNRYRWRLYNDLKEMFESIELSTGGKTKLNRIKHKLNKEHYYDAVCVGNVSDGIKFKTNDVLKIKACGRGSRFRGNVNKCGIIVSNLTRKKSFFGFQTNDTVKAVVTTGKKQGIYFGRVAVRKTGSFDIKTPTQRVQGLGHRFFTMVQRMDGYSYALERRSIIA